jgi:hypothetical protein
MAGSYLDRQLLSTPDHPRLLYAIESFIHGPDAGEFFAATGQAAKEGDTLLICDDFLSENAPDGNRWISEYQTGWHVSSLVTLEGLTRLAEESGWTVEGTQDLSAHVEIDRTRDRLIRLVTGLLRPIRPHSPFWDNLFGGNALQVCLKRGLLRYLVVTLRRGPRA